MGRLYPGPHVLDRLEADTRVIVSEPLRDLPGAWKEVPENAWAVVQPGRHDIQPFQPTVPA